MSAYTVTRKFENRAWGHHIEHDGIRVAGTRVYGDSKREEAQELADLLNAAHALGVATGRLQISNPALAAMCS